jgi:hydrogenase expression/formation protein HypE
MLIQMSHGGGGGATTELIRTVFANRFDNPVLNQMEDAALIDATGPLAYTTDSFVITPHFFPGGDIGRLAIAGTVNDLLMMGARPRWLTAGFILEEGLPIADLERIVVSMADAAVEAGIQLVAGDTKVIEGKGGIYINTSGLGPVDCRQPVRASLARPGDAILVSGPLGDHQASIISQRMQINNQIRSDVGPLNQPVRALLDAGLAVHCLRDATRGGLTTVLNELVAASGCAAEIEEAAIPVRPETRALCDLLGLDPLCMANEGKFVAIIAAADADRALELLRDCPQSEGARLIGHVKTGEGVTLVTRIGGRRRLTIPWYEGLPRIC